MHGKAGGMETEREVQPVRNEDGASAVEYGLLVAAIAALIAVIAFALGGVIREALFEDTCGVIQSGVPDISSSCS
jgi:pilus assembly protein Flp/PilA